MTLDLIFQDNTLILKGVLNNQTIQQDLFVSQRKKIASIQTLTINLEAVTHLDSAGLAWLLNAIRDAKAANISLAWQHIPDKLLQLARLSSAESFFTTPSA